MDFSWGDFCWGFLQIAFTVAAPVPRAVSGSLNGKHRPSDVIVQRQVLDLLRRIRAEHRMALVFVSHDIGVVAEVCTRIAIMYAGQVVETGTTADVPGMPQHPYTIGSKQAFPDIRNPRRAAVSIPGGPPRLDQPVRGCAFAPRCPFARERCRIEKPTLRKITSQDVACHFAEGAAAFRARADDPLLWRSSA